MSSWGSRPLGNSSALSQQQPEFSAAAGLSIAVLPADRLESHGLGGLPTSRYARMSKAWRYTESSKFFIQHYIVPVTAAGLPGSDRSASCAIWNACAACDCAAADKSSILASPKMMYVSLAGLLNTSGLLITNKICGVRYTEQGRWLITD